MTRDEAPSCYIDMHIILLLCNMTTKHVFVRHCLRYREGPTLSFGGQGMVRVNLELELLAIELQQTTNFAVAFPPARSQSRESLYLENGASDTSALNQIRLLPRTLPKAQNIRVPRQPSPKRRVILALHPHAIMERLWNIHRDGCRR